MPFEPAGHDLKALIVSPALQDVLDCTSSAWHPEIGDPTFMGWFTVVAYLLAGVASARIAAHGDFSVSKRARQKTLWVFLALAMLLLAVNKQLDFQSFLTSAGRCMSQIQGWYDDRRSVQKAFIYLVMTSSALVALFTIFEMRGSRPSTRSAVAGLIFLLSYVSIRAAGFHHVDLLINRNITFLRMNWVFELSGVSLVFLGACFHPVGQNERSP
jgi:hypothetical protein